MPAYTAAWVTNSTADRGPLTAKRPKKKYDCMNAPSDRRMRTADCRKRKNQEPRIKTQEKTAPGPLLECLLCKFVDAALPYTPLSFPPYGSKIAVKKFRFQESAFG